MKHTKGNLYSIQENGIIKIMVTQEGGGIKHIATIECPMPHLPYSNQEDEINDNAQRICHCVNNFDEVVEALKGIFELIENGTLVRDISKDDDMAYFIKQGSEINNKLFAAQQAIKKAE